MKVLKPNDYCKKPDYIEMSEDEYNEGHNTRKPPLGSGERFKALKRRLYAKGARSPAGLAASIGRKKYGVNKFQKMATRGRGK